MKDPGNHADKQRDISSLLKSKQAEAYKKSFEGQIKIVEHQRLRNMEVKTLPSDSEDEEDEFLKGREYLKGPPPNVKNKELN